MILNPLMPEFNQAVLSIQQILLPDGFDITSDGALVDTLEKITDHYEEEGRILVWSGGSDYSIYTSPEVNWAFRAWHDYIHITMGATFTKAGEALVCEKQKQHVDLYLSHEYNTAARLKMKRLLDIEINEQVAELYRTGTFITDQYTFTKERL